MKRIRTIIVDDIPLAIKSLEADIADYLSDVLEIVATASGVLDAAKKIKQYRPELILLDVEMQDGDGFDLLDIINDEKIKTIFISGSKEYAVKAFRYSAVDYLLKPVDINELRKTLDSVFLKSSEMKNAYLSISTAESIELIELRHIVRMEASGNYTKIFLDDNESRLVSKTLKSFESKLDGNFIRSHQSHIVNKEFIKSFVKTDGGYLVLKNGTEIPVSVRKRAVVQDKLKV